MYQVDTVSYFLKQSLVNNPSQLTLTDTDLLALHKDKCWENVEQKDE